MQVALVSETYGGRHIADRHSAPQDGLRVKDAQHQLIPMRRDPEHRAEPVHEVKFAQPRLGRQFPDRNPVGIVFRKERERSFDVRRPPASDEELLGRE
jgi:hypothetical protein